MTVPVVLSAAAERAIERNPLEAVAVAVVDFLYGPLAATRMAGRPSYSEPAGYWSVRRGQYRVTISVHDRTVLVRVVRMSHRADV